MTPPRPLAAAIAAGVCLALTASALLRAPVSNLERRSGPSLPREADTADSHPSDPFLEDERPDSSVRPRDASRLEVALATAKELAAHGPGLSSLEALLKPLRDDPRDARLIGFAYGYGYTSHARGDGRPPGPNEVNDRESYFRFLLPGILATGERKPNPLALFESIAATWSNTLPPGESLLSELGDSCLRFAGESGRMDSDRAIDLVISLPGAVRDEGKPRPEGMIRLIEMTAVLSPLSLDSLLQRIEERYPKLLAEILPNAAIPAETMASMVKRLPKPVRDSLARAWSETALNGTHAEIERLIACFPNPWEIPIDVTGKMVVAVALLGSEALDGWLGQLDGKQWMRVMEQIGSLRLGRLNLPVERHVQLWEFRANQILNARGLRKEITEYPAGFKVLAADCRAPQSVPVLQEIADSLKGQMGGKSAEVRQIALRTLYLIKADTEGLESLVAVIRNASSGRILDEANIAESILVAKDRARAEQLRRETADRGLAFRLAEALDGRPDYQQPFPQLFQQLADRVASFADGQLTPGTAKGVEDFIATAAYSDRPMAAALIAKLPEGDLREKTVKTLASMWAKDDPVGASDWLATLPPSHTRDVAIGELVQAIHDDPEVALANAAVIQDPALRSNSATSVVQRWKDLNPEAILDLIRASPLASGDKEALIALVAGSGANAAGYGKQ